MKLLLISVLVMLPTWATAEDIAFGTLIGVKVYDYPNSKVTKLYFSEDATRRDVPGCDGVTSITHSAHAPETVSQFVSIALAAYVSGKKVRAVSSTNTCELDFLAMQESYF